MDGIAAALAALEPYEGLDWDAAVLAAADPLPGRPLAVATPSFRRFDDAGLPSAPRQRFPAFSVTGGACALGCAHCRGGILADMAAVPEPAQLDQAVRRLADTGNLGGFLLSGGSDRRGEIPFERFWPVVAALKRDLPHLRIAAHTGLMNRAAAARMAAAGVDTAMTDVIGAPETIREVCHLERPLEDFAATLEALAGAGLRLVPHVVIGLHFGRLLGEAAALAMVAAVPTAAVVLVVVMPHHAAPGRFAAPEPAAVARLFIEARRRLTDRPLLLGCARPPGLHRRAVDAYAVIAGLDGIAFPADGAVELARALGRPVSRANACCAVPP